MFHGTWKKCVLVCLSKGSGILVMILSFLLFFVFVGWIFCVLANFPFHDSIVKGSTTDLKLSVCVIGSGVFAARILKCDSLVHWHLVLLVHLVSYAVCVFASSGSLCSKALSPDRVLIR